MDAKKIIMLLLTLGPGAWLVLKNRNRRRGENETHQPAGETAIRRAGEQPSRCKNEMESCNIQKNNCCKVWPRIGCLNSTDGVPRCYKLINEQSPVEGEKPSRCKKEMENCNMKENNCCKGLPRLGCLNSTDAVHRCYKLINQQQSLEENHQQQPLEVNHQQQPLEET